MIKNSLSIIKKLILDILLPPFCINCGTEGSYLCLDCQSLIEILERQYCPFCQSPKIVPDGKTCRICKRNKKLNGLFCATSYENKIVKELIHMFKYEPYLAKSLTDILSSFIITHFQLVEQHNFGNCLWIPVPLHRSKLKRRGFNQSEELAKKLKENLGGELLTNVLIKQKATPSQTDLPTEKRKENVIGAFKCENSELIKNKIIFLVDDVFTTGSTLEECARVLKASGAKEVWGVVVARG